MRIVHIITRMIVGGAQENTLLCCRDLLREHGDEVALVTGPALGPEGDLLKQHADFEVPVVLVNSLRRPIHPLRDTRAYFQIRNVLRDIRPDIVHTHSAKGGFLGRLAAHRLGVPVVHTVHGAPFHQYQHDAARMLFTMCERWAARRCDHLICVADAMTDLLVKAHVASLDHCTTIYSGMDVEPFLRADEQRDATRRELGFEPHHVVIGKIARLFHLKGHDDLVCAAEGVVRRNPDVRFLLVGDGILRADIERRLERLGMREHFVLTGLVPPQRIPALIGAMDALVHVSLREGLARALPQALIAGRPVVSYAVDGAPEVVLPEETGLLVEPRNVSQLEQALLRIASDPVLRREWGRVGRQRFTDRFRHQTMTAAIRRLYEDVLAKRSGRKRLP